VYLPSFSSRQRPRNISSDPSILLARIASELEPAVTAFRAAAGAESTAKAIDLDELREEEAQALEEGHPLASELQHVCPLSSNYNGTARY